MLRVGIDVGGTFTDLAAIDSDSGETLTLKVPSTPREPERAVVDAVELLLGRSACEPDRIGFLGHSTTIATNALLGQLGLELPRVALVTTHGFRDVIEIGRQNRSDVYDLFVQRPRPLVARENRFTVRERIDYRGEVVEALDASSLAQTCAALRTDGDFAAIAVCLLHAYVNDAHERRVASAIADVLPNAAIVCSSQVDPEYREYERFSTTVVNALLTPIVARYLDRLRKTLEARGFWRPLYVMRSDGGLTAAEHAVTRPAALVESGPAGGAIAAARLGNRLGERRLLALDMGGTTAKAGAILDGVAQVVAEFEAAGKTHSGRGVRGSGYPVRFPFVDLAEVSAGGGTLAWIDDAGALRVGPLSAGADPGPACYGISDRATVTDANVVLGRLNPTAFLGGTFPIDAARSRASIEALARQLGLSAEQTAAGIVTLVDAQMSKVLRIATIERGLDPRDFTLVAFGGGGPLHACALAGELGVARILIPESPGTFSAHGLLVADVREHYVHSMLQRLGDVDFDALETAFRAHEARGREALLQQGVLPASIGFRREFEARYSGQSFELTIAYATSSEVIAGNFHRAHRLRYGYDVPGETIELVNARLTASGELPRPKDRGRTKTTRAGASVAVGTRRQVWYGGAFANVAIFARDDLASRTAIEGPAIVEQYDSTTYLAPGWTLFAQGDVLVLAHQETSA